MPVSSWMDFEQPQHLGLHGDVQRAGGLVADQQFGLGRERPGDADPLALAAGELGRVRVQGPGRQAHLVDQLGGRLVAARPRTARPAASAARPRSPGRSGAGPASRTGPGRPSGTWSAAAAAAPRCSGAMSVPSRSIRPLVGVTSRTSALAMVDLPQPDSPTTASVLPLSTEKRDVVHGPEGAAAARGSPPPGSRRTRNGLARSAWRSGRWRHGRLIGRRRSRRRGSAPVAARLVPRAQHGDGGQQAAGVLGGGVVDDLLGRRRTRRSGRPS